MLGINNKILIVALAVCSAMTTTTASGKLNLFKKKESVKTETQTIKTADSSDSSASQPNKLTNTEVAEDVESLYDNSLDDNIKIPKLGGQRTKIREYQQIQAKKLKNAGENVETTRNGEVIIATIPCGNLFKPNTAEFKASAGKYLKTYLRFLSEADMWRMLLSMHSDNTGSVAYTDELTTKRVVAVLNWFKKNAATSDYVIPYAMGASDPLVENNSVDNRDKNRRLEIYLVPGRLMIKKASKGILK